MKHNIAKTLLSALFTYFIYSLYVFIIAPYIIKSFDLDTYFKVMWLVISLQDGIEFLRQGIQFPIHHETIEIISYALANVISLYFWFRKQTVPRAWLLSLTGALCGPNLVFFLDNNPVIYASARNALLWLNTFYAAFMALTYIIKAYRTNNGISAKIHAVLRMAGSARCDRSLSHRSHNKVMASLHNQVDELYPQNQITPGLIRASANIDSASMKDSLAQRTQAMSFQIIPQLERGEIANQFSQNDAISEKFKTFYIFLTFSWIIYNSFFFTVMPFFIYQFRQYIDLNVIHIVLLFFFPVIPIVDVLEPIIERRDLVPIFPYYIINITAILYWLKKQTLSSAWLLATAGIFGGQSQFFFAPYISKDPVPIATLCGLFCLNFSYAGLLFVTHFLNKYCANNKLYIWIRAMLAKPCLRT